MNVCSSCTAPFALRLSARTAWSGLLLLLASLLIPAAAAAQPARSWSDRYDGGGIDQAGCPACETSYLGVRDLVRGRQALATDAAGNVYLTGSTTVGGDLDVLTVKFDHQGNRQWAVSYNGGDMDRGFGVAVDGAGNVYVTGQTFVETDYGLQGRMLTLKYDAAGVQQWAATYDAAVASAGFGVAVDGAGNVYAAGEHYSTGDYMAMLIVKYSAAGTAQWVRQPFFGYDYEESTAYDLALDAAGNVHVTGFLYKPLEPDPRDYLTVKYSSAGTREWMRAFDGGGAEEAYGIVVDGSGNALVAGTAGLVRYGPAGTEDWTAPFDGTAHALIQEGGSVYAAGVSSGGDLVAARYGDTGARLWSTPFDLGGEESGYDLLLADGRLYVTGTAGADALLVGFDAAAGGAAWSDLYDGGHDDAAYALAGSGTGFALAGSSGNGSDLDALVLAYSLPAPPAAGPAVRSLILAPPAVHGGCRSSRGKVTLSGPAPAGGAVVALETTNSAAAVPSTVTVPAGATMARFPIATTAVDAVRVGSVTATYGGTSQSAMLTVRPHARCKGR